MCGPGSDRPECPATPAGQKIAAVHAASLGRFGSLAGWAAARAEQKRSVDFFDVYCQPYYNEEVLSHVAAWEADEEDYWRSEGGDYWRDRERYRNGYIHGRCSKSPRRRGRPRSRGRSGAGSRASTAGPKTVSHAWRKPRASCSLVRRPGRSGASPSSRRPVRRSVSTRTFDRMGLISHARDKHRVNV